MDRNRSFFQNAALTLFILTISSLTSAISVRAENYDHIFIVMMENHAVHQILGNNQDAPFINELAESYGTASNFYGVTHPSLPNYLATISGSTEGIWDDCPAVAGLRCPPEDFVKARGDKGPYLSDEQIQSASTIDHIFSGTTLVEQLNEKGLTWKAYMESMPEGFTGEFGPIEKGWVLSNVHRLYAQKHNPFHYYKNIRSNPDQMKNIVPQEKLAADLNSGNVANFVWISPNQCNDMHGLSKSEASALKIPECAETGSGQDHALVKLGDDYLRSLFQLISSSPAWKKNAALIIAWDEDDFSTADGCCGSPVGKDGQILGGGKIPFIVVTSREKAKKVVHTPANHYTLLATLQKLFGLSCLKASCNLKEQDLLTELF